MTPWWARKLHDGRNSGLDKKRRLSAALGESAHKVERGRVGPLQIFECDCERLRPRARENPGDYRRQLPPPHFFGRKSWRTAGGKRNIDNRRKQRCVFGWIETDHPQRALEIGETLFG